MTREIEFHRLALKELRSLVSWYRLRSQPAADRLLAEIDRAVSRMPSDDPLEISLIRETQADVCIPAHHY